MHKWDRKTGLLVGEPWERKSRGIGAMALSPDGKTIACSGMYDGIVQRWNTNGEIVKGIWLDDSSDRVKSLSWSPCGGRLASGSRDGIILVRNAENEGEDVEVGPIKTNQGWIYALAYSPLGDKIASGGSTGTICIWDANTGELIQGPIDDLGSVFSIVWSWDGSKIYSADRFVRVLDSNSGAELHRFEDINFPYSIALSPKHSLLAAVGHDGATRLWDTDSESHRPLGHPFHHEDHQKLTCVSFSQDGRYLAYCGLNYKITLWMVKDIIPEIEVRAFIDRS
jgi:WD40 repeat protein